MMCKNLNFQFQGQRVNPLNAKLNPICHLLALLGAHHIIHVSGVRFAKPYQSTITEHTAACHLSAICYSLRHCNPIKLTKGLTVNWT
jgi:hypothetical protein